MRSTVREQYSTALQDALDILRAIRKRFNEHGALVEAQKALLQWQENTAAVILEFDGPEIAKEFRGKFNFAPTGMSGRYLQSGIETYDELMSGTLAAAPKSDIRRGYPPDVRLPLEQIDELLDRIRDLFRRSSKEDNFDYQTAEDGLRRWKDTAYKVLTPLIGEDEAGEIYSLRAGSSWGDPEGSIEEQFAMHVTHLVNLKEEIQRYPHHLLTAQRSNQQDIRDSVTRGHKVFIVHGHGLLKDAVARALSAMGLEPVILQEKPGAGRTLIEKFEKYSDVGYAVILLAPDDIGGKKGEQQHDRARQNVVFELGYFVGKLGRGCVCMLYVPGVEIPSDYFGVEYVAFDEGGAWKYRLGQELREAGYEIDLNTL